MGLENSRRFRALPVYASLRALGRAGYKDMLQRQISTARQIATFIQNSKGYQLLPSDISTGSLGTVYIIVLFRAVDDKFNEKLVDLINEGRQIFVSGTAWEGQKATRIAVANWQVDPDRECEVAGRVLDALWQKWTEKK
jgi:glutamate/tyrosine decarboxylase-like PLP-dependent enzyme